jgi:hypothetical protein
MNTEEIKKKGWRINDVREESHSETYYSYGIDLLLNWGGSHIGRDAKWVKTEGNEITSKFKEIKRTLKRGIRRLRREINWAIALLKSPLTLDLEDGENEDLTRLALEVLNRWAYLAEAVDFFPQSLPGWFNSEVKKLGNKVMELNLCNVWVRLIPLNQWRKATMEMRRIPKGKEFLFPWYVCWVELPADALRQIVAKWEIPEETGIDNAIALQMEIESDLGLLNKLTMEVHA